MSNYYWSYITLMCGIIIGVLSMILDDTINNKQPQIKPCTCMTLKETLLHIEKVELFVDKLQHAKKGERSAIIDSINFHNTKLQSEGNLIEY